MPAKRPNSASIILCSSEKKRRQLVPDLNADLALARVTYPTPRHLRLSDPVGSSTRRSDRPTPPTPQSKTRLLHSQTAHAVGRKLPLRGNVLGYTQHGQSGKGEIRRCVAHQIFRILACPDPPSCPLDGRVDGLPMPCGWKALSNKIPTGQPYRVPGMNNCGGQTSLG
jgi:hypothetical protein